MQLTYRLRTGCCIESKKPWNVKPYVGHPYHTHFFQGSGIIAEERVEFQEPELVGDYNNALL